MENGSALPSLKKTPGKRISFRFGEFYTAHRPEIWAAAVILLGVLFRVIRFGTLPAGVNQDEAYSAYEAYALGNFGVDSFGHHNPVYLTVWGSGMSALQSYLALPFIKLFGLSVYTIRIPALVCGCLSLPAFYFLLRALFPEKRIAVLGTLILAVSPWHVMLSRWGLDANLAPAFLLFGTLFFVKGLKKGWMLILSGIAFGLTLYCYAIAWLAVPLTLLFFALYLVIARQKVSLKYSLIGGGALALLALPLFLFLLVNKGVIEPIETSFFSIPRLVDMRDSEIVFKNLVDGKAWYELLSLIVEGKDNIFQNTTEYGLFYQCTLPFMAIGFGKGCYDFVRTFRLKKAQGAAWVFLATLAAFLTCLTVSTKNINRTNVLHINTLLAAVIGIREVFVMLRSHPAFPRAFAAIYLCLAISFAGFYFGTYNDGNIRFYFNADPVDALTYVKENDLQDVYVDDQICYSIILFCDKTDPNEFKETVVYNNYPSAFLNVRSFTKFTVGRSDLPEVLGEHETYVIRTYYAYQNLDRGKYDLVPFGNYTVAVKKH